MIKNTNTVNIEGTVIDHDELKSFVLLDNDDPKTKWLIKPLILISGVGLAVAAVFASVFLMAVSLLLVPVLALAGWAMKSNIEKAAKQSEANADAVTDATEVAETAEVTEASDAAGTSTGEPNPAPKQDGMTVIKKLRNQRNKIPIIVITARDAVEDRIAGLDLGADDYMVKPFRIAELMARIRAVARRHQNTGEPNLENVDFSIAPADKRVEYKGAEMELTGKEYRLLHALMVSPGRIYSREELEEKIYGWEEEVNSNAIEFLIHSLRKKSDKSAIRNVRGLGWTVKRE